MATVAIGDNTGTDFTGTEDAQIAEISPTTNFGSTASMYITTWAIGDFTNAVIRFTGLSSISGPVTVSSAEVRLWLKDNLASNHTLSMYRLLRNWNESQVTWNQYASGNNWATAGGTGVADRSATLTASAVVGATTGQYYSWSSAQLAQDVEDFINGVNPNYGWHFEKTVGDMTNYKQFSTSEDTDGQRPLLLISYESAGGGGGGGAWYYNAAQQRQRVGDRWWKRGLLWQPAFAH